MQFQFKYMWIMARATVSIEDTVCTSTIMALFTGVVLPCPSSETSSAILEIDQNSLFDIHTYIRPPADKAAKTITNIVFTPCHQFLFEEDFK